jgi:hypothetical protein
LAPVMAFDGSTGFTAIGDSFCLFCGKWVTPAVPGLTFVTVTDVAWLSPDAIATIANDAIDTTVSRKTGDLRMAPSDALGDLPPAGRLDEVPLPCAKGQ